MFFEPGGGSSLCVTATSNNEPGTKWRLFNLLHPKHLTGCTERMQSSDFCPDMLQKQLLKNNVKSNLSEFEQHSPTPCPEQALLQCGASALLHTLQCYRIRDMIQLPTLFVAAHENVYGFVLFSCFGKMPLKKCHLPLPPPFTHIIWEVWVKCPSRSCTAITSNQALPGVRAQFQRVPCVMGMTQTAPFTVSLPSVQGHPS